MSTWRNVLVVIAGVVLMVTSPAVHAQPIRDRIDTLMTQARQAATIDAGLKLIDQAERLRSQSGAGLSSLERLRFEADLLRVRGALVSRLGASSDQGLNDAQRATAIRDLNRAIRLYREVRTDAEQSSRTIEDRAVKAGSDYTGSKHWQSLVGEATRTIYTTAWCHYALAMLVETTADRTMHLREAIDGFAHFTRDGYRNNPVVVDAFLGQALCLYEQNKPFAIRELLRVITASNAPRAAYQRLTLVQMQAFAAAPSHLEVERVARAYFDSLPAGEALDQVELSMLLLRAASLASLASERSNPVAYRSFQPALEAVAGRLMDEGEPWASRVSALVEGAGGKVRTTALHGIRADFEAARFDRVYQTARAMLADEDKAGTAGTAGSLIVRRQLRWYIAAAAWRLERWHEAFVAASTFAREHVTDEKAAEMAGLAFDAMQRAMSAMEVVGDSVERVDAKSPESFEAFESWVTFAQTHFEGLPQLERLPLYRARLLMSQGQLIAGYDMLATVEPASSILEESLVDRALAAWRLHEHDDKHDDEHDRVSSDFATVAGSAPWLSKAHEALDRFFRERASRSAASRDDLADRGVHLGLMVVRAWLSFEKPISEQSLALIREIKRVQGVSLERRAWRIALEAEAMLLAGDATAFRTYMDAWMRRVRDWDGDEVGGDVSDDVDDEASMNRLAFRILADRLEGRYVGVSGDRPDDEVDVHGMALLVEVYDYLIQSADGETVELRRRLARALYRSRQYERAIAAHERLLDVLEPRQTADVLREMALSYEGLGQWAKALERWRSLARGLPDGTEPWFEAKYHVIRCHDELGDRTQAVKLLKYLRLRHPAIEYDRWERAFATLMDRLGGESP